MSRVTKCTVCGEAGHTRIHCLNICGMCSGDSRNCDCVPPAKKKKTTKGAATRKQQPPASTAAASPPPPPAPSATSTPESEMNYKSLCRSLKQKNQQLGKAYQDIKAKFDLLDEQSKEKDVQLQAAQEEADEMATFVREAEKRVEAYKSRLREADTRISSLEEQLRELQQNGAAPVPDVPVAAKVGRNDLDEIHRRYAKVLAVISDKKCSLNNAYRLAGTARSTVRDFLGIAELKIVNEVTYNSTIERLADPRTAVKEIDRECRIQLRGLLPVVKRMRTSKSLLPLAVDDSFYS